MEGKPREPWPREPRHRYLIVVGRGGEGSGKGPSLCACLAFSLNSGQGQKPGVEEMLACEVGKSLRFLEAQFPHLQNG